MGLMQRRKGRRFEQQVATMLRGTWPERTVRRSLQSQQAWESDVVVEGVPIWWECHDCAAPDVVKKLAQAHRDRTAGLVPVVIWHRLRERVVWATLFLADLHQLLGTWNPDGASPDYKLRCQVPVTMRAKDFLGLVREVLP